MRHRWIAVIPVALVLALGGCSGQDPDQPPANSISAGPKSTTPLAESTKGTSKVPGQSAKKH